MPHSYHWVIYFCISPSFKWPVSGKLLKILTLFWDFFYISTPLQRYMDFFKRGAKQPFRQERGVGALFLTGVENTDATFSSIFLDRFSSRAELKIKGMCMCIIGWMYNN
jgi:hypothetical protein